jgi:hypothetical protein
MAKKKCGICGHAQAMEINSALEAGLFQRDVAAQFSVSKFALSRHKAKCLHPVSTGESSTDDQLEKWLRRADDLYLAAGANGDVRSQVSSLSAAVRSLQSAQRHEAKRAEQDEKPSAGQMQVNHLDAVVEKYLNNLPPGACWHCGGPTECGIYTGPAMPGTFPVLTGRDNSQPEPELQPEPLQEN